MQNCHAPARKSSGGAHVGIALRYPAAINKIPSFFGSLTPTHVTCATAIPHKRAALTLPHSHSDCWESLRTHGWPR